jgi:hypothetical protein
MVAMRANPAGTTNTTAQPELAAAPSFLCRPERVVGMPVARASLCLAAVMPRARDGENARPGMPVPRRLGMLVAPSPLVPTGEPQPFEHKAAEKDGGHDDQLNDG